MTIENIKKIFLYGCFIVTAGAFIYSLRRDTITDSDIFTQVFLSIAYLVIMVDLFLGNFKKVCDKIVEYPFLFMLLLLALLSCFWSYSFYYSLKKVIAVWGITLLGIFAGINFKAKELINLYAFFFGLIMVSSLSMSLFVPAIGVSTLHEGSWMGVFTHKNILGKMATLSFFVFYIKYKNYRNDRLTRVFTLIFILLSLFVLYKSNSATSIFALTLSFAIYLFVKFNRERLWLSVFPVAVVVMTVFFNIEAIILGLGRDITLSGRLFLWIALLTDVIPNNIYLGYGFSSFWQDIPSNLVDKIGWVPVHAHNGYFQILVDLGIVGLVLLLLFLVKRLQNGIRDIKSKGFLNSYLLLILVYYVIYNLSEISFFTGNDFVWMFLISILVVNEQVVGSKFILLQKHA